MEPGEEEETPRPTYHPIHLVFRDLLPFFEARYSIIEDLRTPWRSLNKFSPPKLSPPGTSPLKTPVKSALRPAVIPVTPPKLNPADDPAVLARAEKLRTHRAFGAVLLEHFDHAEWPEDDKLPDRFESDDDANRGVKRSATDRDEKEKDEEPVSKKSHT